MGYNSESDTKLQYELLSPLINGIIDAGGKCYLVGGAVRDKYLGRVPNDYDFIVTGIPNDILIKVLSEYGEVVPNKLVEYAYKVHGILKNPIDVSLPHMIRCGCREFSETFSIEDTLKDYDVTINAMAIDMGTDILIDPTNGISDLDKKILRIVPDPEILTFNAKLILRIARLRAMLGFQIDPASFDIMKQYSELLFSVSKEYRAVELFKMFQYPYYKLGIDFLIQLGIFNRLYLEYDPNYNGITS